MLNPDGVQRGHYRTDSRGVNLNRMYLDPKFSLYPAIYATKALLVFYHIHYSRVDKKEEKLESPRARSTTRGSSLEKISCTDLAMASSTSSLLASNRFRRTNSRTYSVVHENGANKSTALESTSEKERTELLMKDIQSLDITDDVDLTLPEVNVPSPVSGNFRIQNNSRCSDSNVYKQNEDSRTKFSSINVRDSLVDADTSLQSDPANDKDQLQYSREIPAAKPTTSLDCENTASGNQVQERRMSPKHIGNEGSDTEFGADTDPPAGVSGVVYTPHLSDPKLTQTPPQDSGIAFYVDLHGHASKRGCFIYGNYFENEDTQIENMLFPKLISMNTAHFDFTGCNFTERNMYLKDKRDGLSKEGSGRVAVFKSIGIIHWWVSSLMSHP